MARSSSARSYIDCIKAGIAYEKSRKAPPESFPELQDIPKGRYTNPAFLQEESRGMWQKAWLYAAHKSVASHVAPDALKSIVVNYQERRIYHWHEELDRRMDTECIDPELKINPLLSPYIEDD